MKTGWLLNKGKWYYLDGDGCMVKNTTIEGYSLGSDGAWIQIAQSNIPKTKNVLGLA